MNKFQKLIVKIFKIDLHPITLVHVTNDPSKCEDYIQGISKKHALSISKNIRNEICKAVIGGQEVCMGIQREATQLRFLPLGQKGKRALTKTTFVITLEETDYEN